MQASIVGGVRGARGGARRAHRARERVLAGGGALLGHLALRDAPAPSRAAASRAALRPPRATRRQIGFIFLITQ